MSRIVVSPVPAERPIDTIRMAVAWCERRNIPIRLGDFGIECKGRNGWWLTPGGKGCCPLGAVVLMRQPAVMTLPEAPAVALGTSCAYVEGAADGADKRVPSRFWLGAPHRQQYLAGFEDGTRLRMEILSVPCRSCSARTRRGAACSHCGAQP